MEFFDRTSEIKSLLQVEELSQSAAQLSVVTGRRRIGKTALILKAYENQPYVYFFVARKPESELCADFKEEIESKTGISIYGQPKTFAEIFSIVLDISKNRQLTVIIDEFQEFYKINPSIFSEMQKLWDLNQASCRLNLIVCGSVVSLLSKIFTNSKEPLYNRQSRFIHVKPFTPSVIKEIFSAYCPTYTHEDLLTLYSLSGGVAKYVQLLMDNGSFTRNAMLNETVRPDSIFLAEGKSVLIEEFGNDYTTYFAILAAISNGRTRRTEIEDFVGREVSGYLSRLEDYFGFISKKQPLFEKTKTKGVRYQLTDNFFTFWFRFIYKYNYMLEVEANEELLKIIERDFDVFSGYMLERYFRAKLIEAKEFTRIGSWWDRKGENEIDIIAINELEKKAVFIEVKRNSDKISLPALKTKVDAFLAATGECKGYEIELRGLSLNDM